METKFKITIGILAVILIFAGYFFGQKTPESEKSLSGATFLRRTQTASATTTLSYMTFGTGTTSLVVDSFNSANNTAALAIEFHASSTSSTLNWLYEYSSGGNSLDCVSTPSACDWYSDGFGTGFNYSTSTAIARDAMPYSWTFASSTLSGCVLVTAGDTRVCKIVSVPTPTRFTRVRFFLPSGSTNAGIYAEFIGAKETE